MVTVTLEKRNARVLNQPVRCDNRQRFRAPSVLLPFLMAANAYAGAGAPDAVVVTATRIPEPADQIPADISIVSGAELRARDATDMATALSLVAGVEAPAGGDAGPSSAVPSFWGLHEFDARSIHLPRSTPTLTPQMARLTRISITSP